MLKREKAFSVNHAPIWTLMVCVCLLATSTVQAQKVPPIFKDSTTSAFDPQAIRDLETKAGGIDPVAAQVARNKLIAIGVEQVDAAFNDYRKKSRKRHDLLQFIFDFLEIGASSAINIINGGERAREVIAEGLSLFQGSRAAFNRDFKFLERQILFDKMVAKRSQKLTEIYAKLNKGIGEYPWEQARSELRGYFYAGTIDEALSSLSVDTGAEAKSSQKELEVAQRNAGILVAVTEAQRTADQGFSVLDNLVTNPNQAQALAKIKAIYGAVAQDAELKRRLSTLADDVKLDSGDKEAIATALQRIKQNTGTFQDYRLILGELRRQVVNLIPTDPRPNDAFQKILKQVGEQP
jgi:hypothetical protein